MTSAEDRTWSSSAPVLALTTYRYADGQELQRLDRYPADAHRLGPPADPYARVSTNGRTWCVHDASATPTHRRCDADPSFLDR